jgi:hypothetical protein
MRGSALLEELMNLARRRGITIRRETMSRGLSHGGLCVLKGVPTLIVDERASIDAQIEVVASVLRRMDWTDVFLHPTVRTLLTRGKEPDESNDQVS